MGRLLKTLPSLIVGGLINRGSEVHQRLVIRGGNKFKWMDLYKTCFNRGWGVVCKRLRRGCERVKPSQNYILMSFRGKFAFSQM